MMFALFYLHVRCDPFVPFFLLSFVLILLYKIGGQFNERLLLWQHSGIFLYSTVVILVCFMLCWSIKYDDGGGSYCTNQFVSTEIVFYSICGVFSLCSCMFSCLHVYVSLF